MSTVIFPGEMYIEEAVVVKNAKKRYGKNPPTLNGLNMTVSKGSIYGLLGASGCGKSTLLSCIVGVRRLDSGDIWVVGGRPGSRKSGIPGSRVGYMPQDISLVKEFSVIGALYYFGRINGLEDRTIEERHNFLSELLQLPPKNRLVKHMSGGQQRRVSFAAALIHQPELLILDEPTVGLDPVLRENIWNYLVKITQEQGITVVITTHYIEETRAANKIGLMRCGQLLAEATPTQLLNRFQCETLEEAFLILSQRQKDNLDSGITEISTQFISESEEHSAITMFTEGELCCNDINGNREKLRKHSTIKPSCCYLELRKFQALMTKNILQFLRHPGGIMFALLFPLIQIIAFFNAIGRDPQGLVMAVVNDEAHHCDSGSDAGYVIYDPAEGTCDYVNLSCRFLRDFSKTIVQNKYFDNMVHAEEAVKKGEVAGMMYFNRNFSHSLQKRLEDDKLNLLTEELVASEIHVWLDMGDRQIGMHLQKKLFDGFFETYRQILQECQLSPKLGDFPVHMEKPIFGILDQKFSTAMAPGFILTLIFFMATSVTSSIIITDRHEGVWDRSLVQGVNTAQILLAHLLTQLSVIIIQVAVTLSMSLLVFNLGCKGSVTAVIFMVFLIGVCGMAYGFLISVLCSSHTVANYISTGTFYPMVLLCGAIWPIEGMPRFLRYVAFLLPTTLPGLSMRAILDKGYAIQDSQVYSGFLVVSGWTIGLMLLCHLGLRTKIT